MSVESFRDRPYAARRFNEIVDWAREHNPFYRRWIPNPDDVPIIDRMTYLSNNDEVLNGHPVTGRTSGSTGIPVRFSQSQDWLKRSTRATTRFVRQLGGPVPAVMIIYVSGQPAANAIPIQAPVEDQIDFILLRRRLDQAQAVTTYPTNAMQLAEAVLERGVDMSFVRRFGLYGETVERFQIDRVKEAFPNARVWSSYSSMEFGLIATMCPYEPEFHHISAHRLGVEVLDENDQPVSTGEMGRVVITDFLNRRSPFIRYELGDYAIPEPCPCGRIRLPAFHRISGKIRGALLHRNGNRVVFTDLSVALRDTPGMRQYQVIQEAMEEFTVRAVADRNINREIFDAFRAHFGYLPERLRIEYVASIPRGSNGKFHASICRV